MFSATKIPEPGILLKEEGKVVVNFPFDPRKKEMLLVAAVGAFVDKDTVFVDMFK